MVGDKKMAQEEPVLYMLFTTCIGKEKAEEFKKELEDKTGYEFWIKEA